MDSRTYAPERTTLLPAVVFVVGTLPFAATSPPLVALLVLPLAALVWVLRARVVAGPEGLEVCNGLGRRRYSWADVTGFDVPKRGAVRLLLTGDARVPLTTVSRRQLPSLLEVGRRAG